MSVASILVVKAVRKNRVIKRNASFVWFGEGSFRYFD